MERRRHAREFVVYGPDIETTGLDPLRSKILTIQLRIHGHNYIWAEWKDGGEAKIITDFLEVWDRIPRSKKRGGATFIAFNVLHFDVPFIAERCKILGLDNAEQVWRSLVHYPVYLDLYQLLGDSLIGFAKWKGLLVGKANEMSGRDVPRLYENGEYDRILEYVNDELESLERIYDALKHEPFYRMLKELRLRAGSRG